MDEPLPSVPPRPRCGKAMLAGKLFARGAGVVPYAQVYFRQDEGASQAPDGGRLTPMKRGTLQAIPG
jgi:hypothetical protein